jgi:hypothetical protein
MLYASTWKRGESSEISLQDIFETIKSNFVSISGGKVKIKV